MEGSDSLDSMDSFLAAVLQRYINWVTLPFTV